MANPANGAGPLAGLHVVVSLGLVLLSAPARAQSTSGGYDHGCDFHCVVLCDQQRGSCRVH